MTKNDIYQDITNTIIEKIETGTLPWRRGWSGGLGMPLRSNGEYYQGINILLLWIKADEKGYTSDHWFTFKQAKDLNAHVRKGEKSTKVIYYSTFEKENKEGEKENIPFIKTYFVFNAAQIEGLPEKYTKPKYVNKDIKPLAQAENFFNSVGFNLNPNNGSPSYSPSNDTVTMPRMSSYKKINRYYSTLAHELTHWTGHSSRLDRFKKFETQTDYAFEELIAELGASFLCTQLDIDHDTDTSAAYINSWLQALKNDKRFIFKAASAASKATNYLLDISNEQMQDAA